MGCERHDTRQEKPPCGCLQTNFQNLEVQKRLALSSLTPQHPPLKPTPWGPHLPLWVTHGDQSGISKSDSELTAALQAAGHVAALGLCFSSFLKIIFTPGPEFGWVRVGSESTLEGLLGTEVTAADLGSEDPAQTPGPLCPRRRSVSLDCSFSISKSRWKISEGHTSVLPLM